MTMLLQQVVGLYHQLPLYLLAYIHQNMELIMKIGFFRVDIEQLARYFQIMDTEQLRSAKLHF